MEAPESAAVVPSSVPGGDRSPVVSLKALAVRGVLWTVLGYGSSQVLRLAFNLILTRLLFPELFGLMALVWAIVSGIMLFSDIGIAPAVVRDHRADTPDFLNTAWTCQIIRGIFVALLCCLAGPAAALLYGDRRMLWILPLVGLSSAANGFNSTSLLTLQRRMAVSPVVTMDFGVQIISGVLMIVWAWWRPGIAALIAGSLAPSILRMIWSHFLLPEKRDRIAWDKGAVRELLIFGRWIWIATSLTFLASQIDRLILGKLFTLEMLGVYSIAVMFSEVPRALAQAINNNVIFPAYAKSLQLPRADLRARILRYRWGLLLLMAFAVTALTAGGDIIMSLLYDKRYTAASWMLPLLAIGIWPGALCDTTEAALTAVGKPRYAASGNLLKVLFTAAGLPCGFLLAGTLGAVVVVALNDIPLYGRITYGLWREGLNCAPQDLTATVLLAVMIAAALTGRILLGFGVPVHW